MGVKHNKITVTIARADAEVYDWTAISLLGTRAESYRAGGHSVGARQALQNASRDSFELKGAPHESPGGLRHPIYPMDYPIGISPRPNKKTTKKHNLFF